MPKWHRAMPDGFKDRVLRWREGIIGAVPLQGLELGMAMGKEMLITTSIQDPIRCEPYTTRNLGSVAIDEEYNECT